MKNLELFLFLAEEFDSGKDGGGGRPGKRHLKQVSAEMTNTKKKKKKNPGKPGKGKPNFPCCKKWALFNSLCLRGSGPAAAGKASRADSLSWGLTPDLGTGSRQRKCHITKVCPSTTSAECWGPGASLETFTFHNFPSHRPAQNGASLGEGRGLRTRGALSCGRRADLGRQEPAGVPSWDGWGAGPGHARRSPSPTVPLLS